MYQSEFSLAIIARANHVCERCGATENLIAHHIFPKECGGTNDLENGLCVCRACHVEEHKHLTHLKRKETAKKQICFEVTKKQHEVICEKAEKLHMSLARYCTFAAVNANFVIERVDKDA